MDFVPTLTGEAVYNALASHKQTSLVSFCCHLWKYSQMGKKIQGNIKSLTLGLLRFSIDESRVLGIELRRTALVNNVIDRYVTSMSLFSKT